MALSVTIEPVPFLPELFSAPVLARLQERQDVRVTGVPFYEGLLSGEMDALIGSFAREPEVHHPVRGRIKGAAAFARFVADTTTWIRESGVTVEDVDAIVTPSRGVEEFVLHVDGDAGPIALPMALASDLDQHARMTELRIYFSRLPLSGVPGIRPPLLQPDPDLQAPDVVGEYHRALAAGDVDAVVAAFGPDGHVSELVSGTHTHRGTDELRAYYELLLADGGEIPLELCAATDDGRACAMECNLVSPVRIESPPAAGIAVYVRGAGGKLEAARLYDPRPGASLTSNELATEGPR
jgi:hypothetical protein